MLRLLTCLAVLLTLPTTASSQEMRPLSPRGQAATQVGGAFVDGQFQGGSWIVVDYGRPILRGRQDMFGSGDTYGEGFLLGAPIWRIGADQSTRFMTEGDLMFGGQRLPAGEYSIFAELAEDGWTLVFADWGVKQTFQEQTPNALWGSYGYTPDRDVLRTPMAVQAVVGFQADQLTITFTNMTQQGGNFAVWWDDQFAAAPFTVAR